MLGASLMWGLLRVCLVCDNDCTSLPRPPARPRWLRGVRTPNIRQRDESRPPHQRLDILGVHPRLSYTSPHAHSSVKTTLCLRARDTNVRKRDPVGEMPIASLGLPGLHTTMSRDVTCSQVLGSESASGILRIWARAERGWPLQSVTYRQGDATQAPWVCLGL